jgi:hypothetical protein
VIVGAHIPKVVYVSSNPPSNDKIRIVVTHGIEVGITHIIVHEAQAEIDTIQILMSDNIANRLHHVKTIPVTKQVVPSFRVQITIFIEEDFRITVISNVIEIFRTNEVHPQTNAQTNRIFVQPLTTVLDREQTEDTSNKEKLGIDAISNVMHVVNVDITLENVAQIRRKQPNSDPRTFNRTQCK